ncbi:MAG: hypothetical protein IPK14_03945 [Blastocatellia bacterium]|nr:hypothetical protein [Blastocatellia bacterium]
MRKCLNLLLILIVATFFGLVTKQAQAGSLVKISDKNLVLSSDAILTGKVLSIESRWDASKTNIYTDITIALNQTIKGDLGSNTIVIEQVGGKIGDKQVWLTGSPEFSVGEEVLLFLKANSEGVLHTAHMGMGKFSISQTSENKTVFRPSLDKSKVYNAQEYLQNIKELVAANPQNTTNNLKLVPTEYIPGQGERLDNFTLTNTRFFQPDNKGMVTFSLNSTAAPVSGGAVTELNNAITAWNNSGSQLRLVNGGATSICGIAADNQSVVSFSRCDRDMMDPPMGGEGMISTVMLVVNTSNFRIINSTRFNQIMEADILYNNAFNSVLSASKDLEELITHDLGIAFGLDNSSTDPNEPNATLREAIMYFIPHLDKRGARLNTDDQSGVNRLYPFVDPVRLDAATLPVPTVNVAYLAQVTAAAGTPPYTYAVTNGRLPFGLDLNMFGVIAGIPTNVESQTFDVTVTDQANFKATQTFQLATTSLAPRITTVSPSRVSYNSNSMITLTGFNFSTVTQVRLSNGRLLAFQATNNNTIVFGVAGPGMTGTLSDITLISPGGNVTLPSAIFFDGPSLKSARADAVKVRNMKGKFVNQKAIIIKGDGLTLNQQIRINGTAANLTPARSMDGDIVYFGVVRDAIGTKGDFTVTIFDADLNSESNEVAGQRRNPQ